MGRGLVGSDSETSGGVDTPPLVGSEKIRDVPRRKLAKNDGYPKDPEAQVVTPS